MPLPILLNLPPMDVYRVVAWLGWVVNLVVAEYIIYREQIEKPI